MNIEKLARNAINYIDKTWGLPEKGFIAGGSISNLIWEEISGNKAVINDVDVFLLDNIMDRRDYEKESLFSYKDGGKVAEYDDYGGLRFVDCEKNFYSITSSEKTGIFNYVKYDSNITDRKLILESFDLNCVMIGYLIEEDKFIWTKDYEQFIKNQKIEIVNALTPHHTSIRIVKKAKEMNITLDVQELEILEYVIGSQCYDVRKQRFMERYLNMFDEYKDSLGMFEVIKDIEGKLMAKENHNVKSKFWKLVSKEKKDIRSLGFKGHHPSSPDILFYFRKIKNNPKLNAAWLILSDIYTSPDYITEDYRDEDLKLMYNLYVNFQEAILNLRGHTFNEQINLIKKLFAMFVDKCTPIALLQTKKVTIETDLSQLREIDKLLLELSVRKYIAADYFNDRVNKAFADVEKTDETNLTFL